MTSKEQVPFWKYCPLFVVLACLVRTVPGLDSQEKGAKIPIKTLQDSAFKDLLKVVEKNVDKLTARLTSLETTISSMQFYSIRQFNQISGSLQSTNNDLGTVRKQVNQIEIDGRAQKITLSLLGRDVTELKKSSSDLLSELESSIVYVNENLEKQGDLIKAVLEDTLIKSARETTSQLSKQMEEIALRSETTQTRSVNCTVDLTDLSQHIDLRFAEFKKQTHVHFFKLISAAKIDLKKNVCSNTHVEEHRSNRERSEEHICDCKNMSRRHINVDILTDGNATYESDNKTENVTKPNDIKSIRYILQNITKNFSDFENINDDFRKADNITDDFRTSQSITTHIPRDGSREFQDEEDEKVMNALYNMTDSVLQAVSYFRNTGSLLEQVLSNTDSLLKQQTGLSRRLGIIEMREHLPSSEYEDSDNSNMIPGSHSMATKHAQNRMLIGNQFPIGGCNIPFAVLDNIATIIKNGSQLFEVLTDLAQLSSGSLSKATSDLQEEVKRVENVRTHMVTTMSDMASDEESDPISRLINTTQRTFKLIETVASNTKWVPLIFHNVRHLESLTNRSIQIATQNQEILNHVQQTLAINDSPKEVEHGENDPTFSNIIPQTLGQVEALSYSDVNTSSKLEAILNKESLDKNSTSRLKLVRNTPALSKPLAEPDPLVTLAGGGLPDQGRVEIYHKGVSGTLCHTNLSHFEAGLICRHLGFKGGISAGAGYFGPGSGVTWIFNASCLGRNLCAAVSHPEKTVPCRHNQDAAVICDHMLRIVSPSGLIKGKKGRLEIHHKNTWLPVCGNGWTEISARVACHQMGFTNGRLLNIGEWDGGTNSTWLGKITCTGLETRLDACRSDGWVESCTGLSPAGVTCL